MSTRNSIKTFEETAFQQQMFHSQGEIVSRLKRFSVGVKTVLKLNLLYIFKRETSWQATVANKFHLLW